MSKNMTKEQEIEWLQDAVLDCFEAFHSLMFYPEDDKLREEAGNLYEHARLRLVELKDNDNETDIGTGGI